MRLTSRVFRSRIKMLGAICLLSALIQSACAPGVARSTEHPWVARSWTMTWVSNTHLSEPVPSRLASTLEFERNGILRAHIHGTGRAYRRRYANVDHGYEIRSRSGSIGYYGLSGLARLVFDATISVTFTGRVVHARMRAGHLLLSCGKWRSRWRRVAEKA